VLIEVAAQIVDHPLTDGDRRLVVPVREGGEQRLDADQRNHADDQQ
jgi:hypothetical protein